MISERKKYIIKLFLKRCTNQNIMKTHLKFSFELMEEAYKISKENLLELRKKYNIDDYIERLTPLIDEQFTIEEMQEAIKFFSSGIGRKISDPNFLHKIGKVGSKMTAEIEQEFALIDK